MEDLKESKPSGVSEDPKVLVEVVEIPSQDNNDVISTTIPVENVGENAQVLPLCGNLNSDREISEPTDDLNNSGAQVGEDKISELRHSPENEKVDGHVECGTEEVPVVQNSSEGDAGTSEMEVGSSAPENQEGIDKNSSCEPGNSPVQSLENEEKVEGHVECGTEEEIPAVQNPSEGDAETSEMEVVTSVPGNHEDIDKNGSCEPGNSPVRSLENEEKVKGRVECGTEEAPVVQNPSEGDAETSEMEVVSSVPENHEDIDKNGSSEPGNSTGVENVEVDKHIPADREEGEEDEMMVTERSSPLTVLSENNEISKEKDCESTETKLSLDTIPVEVTVEEVKEVKRSPVDDLESTNRSSLANLVSDSSVGDQKLESEEQLSLLKTNSSFAQLMEYSSDDENEEKRKIPELPKKSELKRTFLQIQSIPSSDSEDSSSDTSSCSAITLSSSDEEECKVVAVRKPVKTKGEIALEDLPPIESLRITVPKEECLPLGSIYSIVDNMVVMESLQGTPALNLDSVVFTKKGISLGRIFDVFGPINRPFYVLRFNSKKEIEKKELRVGNTLYCAPQTEHTSYVFTAQLMKEKGSDASWSHNNEPPPECLDYSDDEEEMKARRKIRQVKSNKSNVDGPDTPARKKFSFFNGCENRKSLDNETSRGEDVGWHKPLRRPRSQFLPSQSPAPPAPRANSSGPPLYPPYQAPPPCYQSHRLPSPAYPPPQGGYQSHRPAPPPPGGYESRGGAPPPPVYQSHPAPSYSGGYQNHGPPPPVAYQSCTPPHQHLGTVQPPRGAPFCSSVRPPPVVSVPPPQPHPQHNRPRSTPPALHRFGHPPNFQQPPPYQRYFPPPTDQLPPSSEYF